MLLAKLAQWALLYHQWHQAATWLARPSVRSGRSRASRSLPGPTVWERRSPSWNLRAEQPRRLDLAIAKTRCQMGLAFSLQPCYTEV